jgi:hypothetical protein
VCDPSNEECCTSQCSFQTNGTVCRPSTGPCDPQEVCSGTSAGCPTDLTAPDGQSCGNDGLTCASGRCTSRDLQCRTFMGADATTSCSNSGCRLSCHSSQLGPNECYVYNQYFLDGTPCEGGGKCSNGNCQGGSLWNRIVEWINDNKQISIPVFCVAGGLLLLAILSCCWSCFSRRRRRRVPKIPSPPPPRGWNASGGGVRTPPPMAQPGASYAPVPGQDVPPQDRRWEPLRTRSFRYA